MSSWPWQRPVRRDSGLGRHLPGDGHDLSRGSAPRDVVPSGCTLDDGLGRQLEHRSRAAAAGQAIRPHSAPYLDHAIARVEEDEVERKAHAEGVDAAAAADQQPLPRLRSPEEGKAEKTCPAANGDGDVEAKHGRPRHVAKSLQRRSKYLPKRARPR